MKRIVRLAIGLVVVFAGLLPLSAGAAPSYPNSMASTGDSITRAFDMSVWPWCLLSDCPAYSWSTGTSSSEGTSFFPLLTVLPEVSSAGTGVPIAR